MAVKLPHLPVLYQCAVSAKMTAANSLTPRCTCTHTISSLKTGVFLRCQEACGWLIVAHKGSCPKWPSRRHQEDASRFFSRCRGSAIENVLYFKCHRLCYNVSVLGRDKGYMVKYNLLAQGVPEGKARGNS